MKHGAYNVKFAPYINSANDIDWFPQCCVKEFPSRIIVIVSRPNAPSVARKESRVRHRRQQVQVKSNPGTRDYSLQAVLPDVARTGS